jgi:peptide/nickel transport system permease protein
MSAIAPSAATRVGYALLALVVVAAIAAPVLAPNAPDDRFGDLLYAPPTRVHVWDGGLHVPFIYRQRLVSRIERRFEEDRTRRVTVPGDPEHGVPLLLLGADSYGRDLFARLLYGARISLALALLSALGAVTAGALIGGVAGYAGGWLDAILSRSSEFLLVLPTMYVVLVLRAMLPEALGAGAVFALLTAIFMVLGWPTVARGTRALVAAERERDYVTAARAIGMSPARLLLRHLLPSTTGYLGTQFTLLVPAFILAEATLSYIGFGFPVETATWGTMLQDTGNVLLLADAPWLLAPAAAIFLAVLAINLVVQGTGRAPVQLAG